MLRRLVLALIMTSTVSLAAAPKCEYVKSTNNPDVGVIVGVRIDSIPHVCLDLPGYKKMTSLDSVAYSECRKESDLLRQESDALHSALDTSKYQVAKCLELAASQERRAGMLDSAFVLHVRSLALKDSVIALKDSIIANRQSVIKSCEDSQMGISWLVAVGAVSALLGLIVGGVAF